MRILFFGDVIGRAGRDGIADHLPKLRDSLKADFCIVNGENAAAGYGITDKICKSFYEIGVDAITTGNHIWDQREIIGTIDADTRLLRPANFPPGTPGRGTRLFQLADGRRIAVINIMCRLFMDAMDDPFAVMDRELQGRSLGGNTAAILVDVHGEASSEKMAMGHHLDGRVSAVIGTHTHTPTADAQILPGGTGFQSDAGMCGDYDSVIGMQKGPAVHRFIRKMPGERLTPAEGEATVCGTFLETDDTTGKTLRIEPIRMGGRLSQAVPHL